MDENACARQGYSAAMTAVLQGVRILEVAEHTFVPAASALLSDWGAEVIKIEQPPGADPDSDDLGGARHAPDFQNLHRNKRSMTLDLKQKEAVALFKRLVEKADVVVENYRPDVKHRLGIDYESLRAVNKRLVYGSVSGFGQQGPYQQRPGVDQIAQGLGGLMSVTGPPGSGPWRVGIAISDTAAGTLLTQGVLAALIARDRTGRGQWVHTSLLEAMVSFMDFQAARWLIDGEVPQQEGNQHPTMVPMGAYPTADGHLNVSALRDFRAFCELLDAPDLADDLRYVDFVSRHAHRAELDADLARILRTRTTAEWVARLAEHVPCGPVLAVDEVFEDPQVQHLQLTRNVPHPTRGDIDVLRPPLTFSDTPATVRSGPPADGEHTRAVLAELGYSDDEIDDLHASGAVGTQGAQ
jgi:crotonobetainyl-CoA:carnitine CoA-transferase CaiB-like acyl-CoA transferase